MTRPSSAKPTLDERSGMTPTPITAPSEMRRETDLTSVRNWLAELPSLNMDEIAADGGVTVAMVVQQEAQEMAARLDRALTSRQPPSLERENLVGAAEAELGRYIYRRIEALMDAKPGTAEGAELTYLATIAESVEEYGEEHCGGSKLAEFPSLEREEVALLIRGAIVTAAEAGTPFGAFHIKELSARTADAILALASPKGGEREEGRQTNVAPQCADAGPYPRSQWRDIASAPRDRLIEVFAPAAHGLNSLVSLCEWHEDAGFCICELREPTHWRPHAPPSLTARDRRFMAEIAMIDAAKLAADFLGTHFGPVDPDDVASWSDEAARQCHARLRVALAKRAEVARANLADLDFTDADWEEALGENASSEWIPEHQTEPPTPAEPSPSGRTGSGAYTAEGQDALDTLNPSPSEAESRE